jgi:hypothetical protein
MGILDEAIREHLELKRQHGADDSELKQLEDDAFGPPERPGSGEDTLDPLAEAPTQFMAQPDAPGAEAAPTVDEEARHRHETTAGILDLQEAPEATEPSEEEQPAGEHEAVVELEEERAAEADEELPVAQEEESESPPEESAEFAPEESAEEPAAGHSTEERHALAEHPTEHYDVEEEFSASGPSKEEEPAAESVPDDEEEDDFFNEQRLSDELDQALEAPRDQEPEEELEPAEEPLEEPGAEEEPEPEEDPEPEEPRLEESESEEPGEAAVEEEQSQPAGRDEDVLEETPDFLEETPEDDELWFEQKPPKDFDFDD